MGHTHRQTPYITHTHTHVYTSFSPCPHTHTHRHTRVCVLCACENVIHSLISVHVSLAYTNTGRYSPVKHTHTHSNTSEQHSPPTTHTCLDERKHKHVFVQNHICTLVQSRSVIVTHLRVHGWYTGTLPKEKPFVIREWRQSYAHCWLCSAQKTAWSLFNYFYRYLSEGPWAQHFVFLSSRSRDE